MGLVKTKIRVAVVEKENRSLHFVKLMKMTIKTKFYI